MSKERNGATNCAQGRAHQRRAGRRLQDAGAGKKSTSSAVRPSDTFLSADPDRNTIAGKTRNAAETDGALAPPALDCAGLVPVGEALSCWENWSVAVIAKSHILFRPRVCVLQPPPRPPAAPPSVGAVGRAARLALTGQTNPPRQERRQGIGVSVQPAIPHYPLQTVSLLRDSLPPFLPCASRISPSTAACPPLSWPAPSLACGLLSPCGIERGEGYLPDSAPIPPLVVSRSLRSLSDSALPPCFAF